MNVISVSYSFNKWNILNKILQLHILSFNAASNTLINLLRTCKSIRCLLLHKTAVPFVWSHVPFTWTNEYCPYLIRMTHITSLRLPNHIVPCQSSIIQVMCHLFCKLQHLTISLNEWIPRDMLDLGTIKPCAFQFTLHTLHFICTYHTLQFNAKTLLNTCRRFTSLRVLKFGAGESFQASDQMVDFLAAYAEQPLTTLQSMFCGSYERKMIQFNTDEFIADPFTRVNNSCIQTNAVGIQSLCFSLSPFLINHIDNLCVLFCSSDAIRSLHTIALSGAIIERRHGVLECISYTCLNLQTLILDLVECNGEQEPYYRDAGDFECQFINLQRVIIYGCREQLIDRYLMEGLILNYSPKLNQIELFQIQMAPESLYYFEFYQWTQIIEMNWNTWQLNLSLNILH